MTPRELLVCKIYQEIVAGLQQESPQIGLLNLAVRFLQALSEDDQRLLETTYVRRPLLEMFP